MNCIELKSLLLLASLILSAIAAETPDEDDVLETGYLYEKPNISLLFPSQPETEVSVSMTEKEEIGSPTTPEVKEPLSPEEINVREKPELKATEGYLPPEEEDLFGVVAKENLETVTSDENYSKGRKGKTSVVKRKINALKEKEKARVRQVLGPQPKQDVRTGISKESKQNLRH